MVKRFRNRRVYNGLKEWGKVRKLMIKREFREMVRKSNGGEE